jgi:hypothetical protein
MKALDDHYSTTTSASSIYFPLALFLNLRRTLQMPAYKKVTCHPKNNLLSSQCVSLAAVFQNTNNVSTM